MRLNELTLLVLLLPLYFSSPARGQSASATPISDITVTTAATVIGSATGNAFRNEMSCTNQSTTIAVRWGNSGVTATKGQRIGPGAAARIENRGPIYMIAESSTATVSCTEETR